MKREKELVDLEARMKKEVAECARNKTYRKSFYNQHKKKI